MKKEESWLLSALSFLFICIEGGFICSVFVLLVLLYLHPELTHIASLVGLSLNLDIKYGDNAEYFNKKINRLSIFCYLYHSLQEKVCLMMSVS